MLDLDPAEVEAFLAQDPPPPPAGQFERDGEHDGRPWSCTVSLVPYVDGDRVLVVVDRLRTNGVETRRWRGFASLTDATRFARECGLKAKDDSIAAVAA